MNLDNQLQARLEKIAKARRALENKLKNYCYYDRLAYACVQGSTNYNLDVYNEQYESDVDWKVFIFPTFEDLYTGEKTSTTFKYECGQFELKDIRLLPELLGKMNSSYIELLFSEYTIVFPQYETYINQLRELGNGLVEDRLPLLVKSLMGMCNEKSNSLCHEYESLKEKLAYFGGYDPKQLHHALRILNMLQIINGCVENHVAISYENIMKFGSGPKKNYLIDIKVNGTQFGLPEALDLMKDCLEKCQKIYNKFWDPCTKKPIYPHKTNLNNYITPISNFNLNKIEEIVYELVRNYFVNNYNKF